MNAHHFLRRITAGAALSGGVAIAGFGLGAGVAQAYPLCTPQGVCATQWCPGKSLPAPDVKWDMTVCHDFLSNSYPGTVQVGSHTWEGNPCGPQGPFCFPRKVPS
jgi:hypothetical protein